MNLTDWTNNFASVANSWQKLTGGGASQPTIGTPAYATQQAATPAAGMTSADRFVVMVVVVVVAVVGLIFWGRKGKK